MLVLLSIAGKEDLFTIEMHYNGLLQGNEYQYGLVAYFDRIDPDYFTMIELNVMAKMVNIEGDHFQYLWAGGIENGLQSIECEEDILAFTKAKNRIGDDGEVLGLPFTVIQIYVKKLTKFKAWKRMGQIKMQIVDDFIEKRRVQFTLEELNDEPEDEVAIGKFSGCASSASKGNEILMLPWIEPTPIVDAEQQHPRCDRSCTTADDLNEIIPLIVDVAVDHVEVNGGTDFDEMAQQTVDVASNLEGVQAGTEHDSVRTPVVDVAVDPLEGNVGTRWLAVDDVLADMRHEQKLNELVDLPLNDSTRSNEEPEWSSPTIPSSEENAWN
ncbi:hypothetical protein LINPERPRIM_LOCUS6671 [Linum perenne]